MNSTYNLSYFLSVTNVVMWALLFLNISFGCNELQYMLFCCMRTTAAHQSKCLPKKRKKRGGGNEGRPGPRAMLKHTAMSEAGSSASGGASCHDLSQSYVEC